MSTRFISLPGLTSYESARKFQLDLVEKRVADQIGDTVLFLEHSPTVTRGQGLQYTGESSTPKPKHMPLGVLPPGTDYAESERGGDLTWHGPGQLVIYPIVKLVDRDLGGFLRFLESLLIQELRDLGLDASRKEKASGVWVGTQKVASMGVAVRKWVTFHGVALNVTNSLEGFRSIAPCGFSPEVMSRLVDLLPPARQKGNFGPEWREFLEKRLIQRWSAEKKIQPIAPKSPHEALGL